MPDKMRIEVAPNREVTALLYTAGKPVLAGVTVILGHGAGADQNSDFMTRFATGLAARGINVVTFNFLYTEQGRRVPDANKVLEACFRVVIEAVRHKKIGCGTLVIGGKSMGGRIASQVAAASAPGAEGLIFLGYPLHPPGRADQLRAKHLPDITVPMLFVQGSRDAFGSPDELRPIIKALKAPADLDVVEGGDHSFKVLKRAGVTQEDAYKAVLDRIELWLRQSFVNLNWRPAVPVGKTKSTHVRAEKPLKEYAGKRDFARTPEPAGSAIRGEGREFVVQKHAARRLHYDLRLEMDGVLKSWAVTKGPSLTVGDKRLAVRTEDHPIEYLDFEGNIPKGEYGAGSMIVWDRGRWEPEGDPQKGLAKGHLAFALDGTRLKGRWHLVRMRPRSGEKTESWLLIKSDDAFARDRGDREITAEEATSHISGRTNEELAATGEIRKDHAARVRVAKARKAPLPNISKLSGARAGLLPAFLDPSLAASCEKPPSGPTWIHEIKYDGYRMQARIDGRAIRLLTRKKLDWTERFLSIADALKSLGLGSALIDGEIVVEDASGITSFNDLQVDLKTGRLDRFRYFVFDILYCEGFDLTKAVLKDRKDLLRQLLAILPPGSPIRLSEHLDVDGATMLEHACRFGLEGIVSKRADLPYRPGRGDHWIKSKCLERQEFIILGYIPSTAASRSVGSLALGYHDNKNLVYAGRVGTGWSQEQARSLYDELETISAIKPSFAKLLPAGTEKGVRWVEPRLVCEIEYRGWTGDRLLRAAAFKGLRDDKSAEELVLEAPPKRSKSRVPPTPVCIRLTHPERILWEEAGITKQGLAEFYTDVADWILPHVAGRPLSLLRCPSGTGAKCFFAKHPWQGLDKGVRRVDTGDKEPMLVVDDVPGLISLVQAGVVEIHPWGSTIDHLEQPDRLIFDLDPGENVPWEAVIDAAYDVRDRLATLGLQSYVKTSGGKGLHIVAPIQPEAAWDEVKTFTKTIAGTMAKERADRYVATMAKRGRGARIFVDYLRNDRGATAVAAYSTRALPRASVSIPLNWEELSPGLHSDHFTVGNALHRLSSLKRDPWRGFFKIRQRLPQFQHVTRRQRASS